ncbi:AsmA-like C-terminal region-containing protein [Paracoccaceae bacterium]|nr:AsmA-like C-terminal region-containing protein [Paracoccaceae bacterium]
MNISNKQGINILKIIFSNIRRRFLLFVSLILMLVLTGALVSIVFLSESTLNKLAQSKYFQNKITQVLQENDISSNGLISITFNNLSSADIALEEGYLSSFNNLVGYDINLKVDFIKYWLGSSFINEVFIKTVDYHPSSNFSENFNNMNSVDFKSFTNSMHFFLNKINSDTIFIDKGTLTLQNQIFNFEKIFLLKKEKSLNAKAILKAKPDGYEITYAAKVNFSLNPENIINFNIDMQDTNYKELFNFKYLPKVLRLFLGTLTKISDSSDKKWNALKLAGAYDLNSTILKIEATDISNKFKLTSSINILESFENNDILFENTELVFGDYALFASNLNFNIVERTYKVNVTKFLAPYENNSVFSKGFKVFGNFSLKGGIISKINILGENPFDLKASMEILQSSKLQDNEQTSFDFFVKLDALKKIRLNSLGGLLDFYTTEKNKDISLSSVDAKISLQFGVGNVELNSFNGKINNLVYFENNKPLFELESIELGGNLTQGYAAISSVTKVGPRINKYRDVKLELSSTGNIEDKREITLSFRSKLSGLISLIPKIKTDLTWLNSLARSHGEKDLSFTYSKAIEFKEIEKFFSLEENMFELNIDDLLIPFSATNSINLAALNLKGVGNTIFFDVVMATNNRKISGSINNWLSNIYTKEKASNLIIVFDNLDSKTLFPEFSTFNVNGPLKLTFYTTGKNDNFLLRSSIDLTKADVYVPAIALKKVKGKYGHLKLDFIKDNRSLFEYSQNDVLVSGTASHKSIFEIKKVEYSNITTPDIQIKRATFERFGEYNQFKTNKGTISLEFLMRLSFKKKKIPLDFIFSDIVVTFKKNKFLHSLKGEIRSFEGLRGYAKAKSSSKSNIEIIISPHKHNGITLVISGNDAGEFLRKGKYYENGYGGLFKASIFYKNRGKMSGSLQIEEFRIKNAPVLAQIISSASIIGLLDTLNGNGLLFTKIEGSFDYKDSKLTLKNGVAVGPSLGLTMGGYEKYEKKQNTVNVNGLVSPVYIINGVVKAIPLIGKVLGGEKGEGVFGVSYKVQGNSSNPRVLVNPLSLLTPGVFRKIFNGNK